MRDTSDMELVREYVRLNSEGAFAELVQRHINLVYSVALRHTEIAAEAEEITQAVFIILARKAASLRPDTILEGWLYETTRLTSLSFMRGERRRRFREQEAYMQSSQQESNDQSAWNQLAPLLDEAMARLNRKDRDAVILRFFKDKSVREVAAAMQVSEPAAQRRVLRALEKLRNFFTKRGVSSTTAIIAETIATNSVQAAPVALAKSVTAVATIKGSIASASILTLVKGTMKVMTWMKLKFAVYIGATAMLVGGVATVALSGDEPSNATDLASSPFQLRVVLNAPSADSKILTLWSTNSVSGKVSKEDLNVQNKVLLDQSALESASVSTNSFTGQQPDVVIDFTLTSKGKKLFAKVTRENIGRRLAIIVDGKVISAPVIRSEIPSGHGHISGNFTLQEATRLAAILNKPANN